MQQTHALRPQPTRGGFSLMELVVILVIIAILVSLTLPAMESAKQSSRRVTCLNNSRNVGLAIVNFSSGANSELPWLVDENQVTGSGANAANDDLSWCTTLLPFLDAVRFRQYWDEAAAQAAQEEASVDQIRMLTKLNHTRFPVLTCPDDQNRAEAGALTYIVNVGYVTAQYNSGKDYSHAVDSVEGSLGDDTATDEDPPIRFATGVFWRPNASRMSLDYISAHDGITYTLMLSENLQAGRWFDRDTGSLGFGIDMQGVYPAGTNSLRLPTTFQLQNPDTGTDSSIGSNLTAARSQAWRPSSNHPSGAVNVIFCDGSGRSLTPQIDPAIYARLLTPAGLKYDQRADDPTAF